MVMAYYAMNVKKAMFTRIKVTQLRLTCAQAYCSRLMLQGTSPAARYDCRALLSRWTHGHVYGCDKGVEGRTHQKFAWSQVGKIACENLELECKFNHNDMCPTLLQAVYSVSHSFHYFILIGVVRLIRLTCWYLRKFCFLQKNTKQPD